VSAPFSDTGSYRSVADIVDEATLRKVRDFKQELKAATKASATKAKAPKASATKASATKAKASKAKSDTRR
jgi:hypothetical protein